MKKWSEEREPMGGKSRTSRCPVLIFAIFTVAVVVVDFLVE
jgi:hypothetical protein